MPDMASAFQDKNGKSAENRTFHENYLSGLDEIVQIVYTI